MDYTAIAQTGEAFLALLKRALVPCVVPYEEQIALCAPQEKGDFSVKVWLYDIKKCSLLQSHDMVDVDGERQKYPSVHVELCYMVTAFSNGDIRDKAKEEAHILGKVLQALTDEPAIVWEKESGKSSRIELINLPMEDKLRICHVPDGSYKASLFYEIGPVEIESERVRTVKRVRGVSLQLAPIME
ncbi:MAG: DUF4255 domain-containing protein [Blautia sp.]|nr:DUF4255 domain-containing protein [Blautia sp.]